ncbi:putative MFS monocarboxylate transporter [Geopyxis carbonaria]|nr:putative MFS monocarboxylate transporter [Geopyxis carbonaria]
MSDSSSEKEKRRPLDSPPCASISEGEDTSQDGQANEDVERQQQDMGLQLTCSLRSGVGRQELEMENPPDGGLQAWLQVLGVHLTIVTTWGFINSFGVYQTYYVEALGNAPSTISWIGSIQIFLLFFLGTFTGRALDAGYFYYTYRAGSLLVLLGIFATSWGTKYWHIFLSQGLCCGIGSGMMFCPCLALCSTYFRRRRSLALGLGACGSATGGIIIPVVVQQLLPRVGFAWTTRTLGFICLVFLTVSNAILRPRVKPRKVGGLVDWGAFREPPYVLFAIGMFLIFLGLYFAFFYISAFARDILHLSQTTSFNTLIIMNAVGLPGRILPNFLADRALGPLNLIIPCGLIVGILLFSWMAVASYGGLLAWACVYGTFAAGIQSLFPATLSSLTTDLAKAGTRMGMIFSIISVACLTGTPVGGALIQRQGGAYSGAMGFAGGCVLVGACVLTCARVCKVGWGVKKA